MSDNSREALKAAILKAADIDHCSNGAIREGTIAAIDRAFAALAAQAAPVQAVADDGYWSYRCRQAEDELRRLRDAPTPSAAPQQTGEPPAGEVTDAEILAALEAAGVQFMAFPHATKRETVRTTAGSQPVDKIIAGVRAAYNATKEQSNG